MRLFEYQMVLARQHHYDPGFLVGSNTVLLAVMAALFVLAIAAILVVEAKITTRKATRLDTGNIG